MPYYLKHHDHGVHIAYTPEEVEVCKQNGWIPVEEEKPSTVQDVVIEAPIKRRGRKPKG